MSEMNEAPEQLHPEVEKLIESCMSEAVSEFLQEHREEVVRRAQRKFRALAREAQAKEDSEGAEA